MIPSMRILAWFRDLVIALLFIAGFELRHTSTRLGLLLMISGLVIFAERILWSWYLLNLRDQQEGTQGAN